MLATRQLRGVLAFGLIGAAACGGGDGPSGSTETIEVSVSPASLSVAQGGSGVVTLTLTRGGGFTGVVNASVTGLPAGITTIVAPNPLTGSTTLATVTVNVAGTVAVGTYTATVRASATGLGEVTKTYDVVVTPAPGYTLAVAPTSATVAAGTNGAATVNLTRVGGFAGAVALSLVSPPQGITGTFNPVSATGNTSALSVSVPASATPGTYSLTIQGTASGLANQTTTFALTVSAAANFSLAVTPTPLSVQAGQSGNGTVTITRTNFTGSIDLALDSPPTGVTATFTPASTTGTTSAMVLNVGSAVIAGNYNVTVRGTAADLSAIVDDTSAAAALAGIRTFVVVLTVTAAPPPASIALGVSPTPISIQQAQNGQSTVTITRTNFTGTVNFAATVTPAGPTVAFNPTAATANSSVVTVTVGAAVPVGAYQIVITGSGTGISNAQTTLTVNVTAAPSGSQVEFQFCSVPANPIFFASQDGTGAWTRVVGVLEGSVYKYRFQLSQGRGGVYYVQQSGTPIVARAVVPAARLMMQQRERLDALHAANARRLGVSQRTVRSASRLAIAHSTTVSYLTTAEMQQTGLDNCALSPDATKTVNVTHAGVPSGAFASLTLGGSGATIVGGATPSPIAINDVRTGVIDAIGTRLDGTFAVDRVFKVRDLNPANNSTLGAGGASSAAVNEFADFLGANSSAPLTRSFGFTNQQGDQWQAQVLYQTPRELAIVVVGSIPSTATTSPVTGFPDSRVLGDERHLVTHFFQTSGSTSLDDLRLHFIYQNTLQNKTVALPEKMTNVSTQVVNASARTMSITGTADGNLAKMITGDFTGANGNNFFVTRSSAFGVQPAVAGAGANFLVPTQLSISMPDLRSVTSFPIASLFGAGMVDATLTVFGWNLADVYIPLLPAVGTEIAGAARSVQTTIP